jgi:alpha 1,3-glucosidase
MYSFNFFNGTDDLFHVWLDMNEPTVFDGPEGTMPKTALHTLDNGSRVMSRDVKNVYGL